MPAAHLTRLEAEERVGTVHAPAYEVELDLTGDGGTFGSTTVVRFRRDPERPPSSSRRRRGARARAERPHARPRRR